MTKRIALSLAAAVLAVPALATSASAMHGSPAPVDEMAPSFSGHYSVPDVGQKGEARPWVAGPVWNR